MNVEIYYSSYIASGMEIGLLNQIIGSTILSLIVEGGDELV